MDEDDYLTIGTPPNMAWWDPDCDHCDAGNRRCPDCGEVRCQADCHPHVCRPDDKEIA